jgi:hypothetical protein
MNRKSVEAAALFIGLSLFLFACEKEISAEGSGKKVDIIFAIDSGDYETGHSITRSAEIKDLKPETVVIPLDNELYMYATLIPDTIEEQDSEELRATAAFVTGQKICFAAYPVSGTIPLATAVYRYNGTKFVPETPPLGVEPDGTTYHFVAYSYFGDPTATPSDTDIDPSKDLVWGEANKAITDTEAGRTVIIEMKHRFSRVRVRMDASWLLNAEITAISNVVIGGGKKANLTIHTGAVAPVVSSDVTAALVDWEAPTLATRLSGYKVFYSSLTKVTVGSMTIKVNGSTLPVISNRSLTFAQTLASNTNYTVVVDVRGNRWAYSNIYWDTNKLTFDKTPTNPSHENYQGVFFRWGSLIGLSPKGGETTNDINAAAAYIPNVASKTWTAKTIGTHGLHPVSTGWGGLPYNNTSSSTNATTENFLYDLGDSFYSDYRGDICNYMDAAWRMPNMAEFGINSSTYNPQTYTAGSDPDDATGKGSMNAAGVTYNSSSGITFFPASGYRGAASGSPFYRGSYGMYWSGSGGTAGGEARYLDFRSNNVTQYRDESKTFGFSVRCIKKLPTE